LSPAEEVIDAGQRAASLTRQLLAFSRKQVLRPSLLNLTEIARNMEDLIRRMIGEHINLQLYTSPGVKFVSADRAQLEQLLMNLAINAKDAMPLGGNMVISIANTFVESLETQERKSVIPGVYVKLRVRDTGIGMTAATKARIFDPFFTTKEAGKGTGLGLSTVHGIVEQSGGYITVDSEPGRGAEFCVYFKAVDNERDIVTASKGALDSKQPLIGSGTILLVEDEDALRSIVGNTLRSNGYKVLEARDGVTGIDLIKSHGHAIDLLLTDVILPFMSGRAIADEFRVSRPESRIIYMSGYTDDIIAQHGVVDADVILLEKPFSRALLLETVREAIPYLSNVGDQ
jgi:CheY-like chemotaxis protein